MSTASIREAIERISSVITDQPEARAKNVPATARLLDGLRCEVKGPNGESVLTDMPPTMGGTASAAAPGWLLRASWRAVPPPLLRCVRRGLGQSNSTGSNSQLLRRSRPAGFDDRSSWSIADHGSREDRCPDVPADQLRALAEWGDHHSPIACTARSSPDYSLEVEVV